MSWICLVLQIPYGLGRHGLIIPTEDRIKFEQITFWKTVFSDGVALGLLRVSMAISLLRPKSDLRWYRWSLFAVIGESMFDSCFVGKGLLTSGRFRCGLLDPGYRVAVCLLHAVLGVVGVSVDEPVGSAVQGLYCVCQLGVLEHL